MGLPQELVYLRPPAIDRQQTRALIGDNTHRMGRGHYRRLKDSELL